MSAVASGVPDPRACRFWRGRHGWLLWFRDGSIVVARECEGGGNPPEALLDQGEGDPRALHLFLHGDKLAAPVLDAIDRVVAGSLDPSQRVIALLLAEQRDDRDLHRGLKMLESAAQVPGERFGGVHRVVSYSVRIAARARQAGSRSIMNDLGPPCESLEAAS